MSKDFQSYPYASNTFKSFQEFYPYYLKEHKKPATKLFHFAGSNIAVCLLITALITGDPRYVLLAII